ncbi:hypothetical protein H0H87_003111 [Tephrocybe sp. NHM501043]|nr:hypothetical protein H0H87_003111 [Tephrocybe sp. NHM501043]
MSQSALKGKGHADFRNQLPHLASANFAGLQFDGEDILMGKVLSMLTILAVPSWHALTTPVTHSGKETHCHDPLKKPVQKTTPEPALSSNHKQLAEHQTSSSNPPRGTLVSTSTPCPEIPKPPPVNTHKGQRKKTAKDNAINVDDKKHAKHDSSYHFVSTIQKMFDPDVMIDNLLKTTTTTSIGALIGTLPVLQKCFNKITQLHHEYVNKQVLGHFAESLDMDIGPCECNLDNLAYTQTICTDSISSSAKSTKYAHSQLVLDCDPDEISEEDISVLYRHDEDS